MRGVIEKQFSKNLALLIQRKRYGNCGISFLGLAID
jgi:hypothetical protein